MLSRYVDLKVYFEGYLVPVNTIMISERYGSPVQIQIIMPFVKEIGKLYKGTLVHIFYYDSLSRVYRYMIEGEVSRIIRNRTGNKESYSIIATGDSLILDNLPSRYFGALGASPLETNEIMEFYHMDGDAEVVQDAISKAYFNIQEKEMDSAVGIVKSLLNIMSNSWEYYYKNQDKRHHITDDHGFLSLGYYSKSIEKEAIEKLLNRKASILKQHQNDGTLSQLLYILSGVLGYEYYRIVSPSSPAGQSYEKKLKDVKRAKWQEPKSKLLRYVLSGSTNNLLPPRCNVLEYNDIGVIDVNVGDIGVTRYRQIYRIINGSVELHKDYPEKELKKSKYSFLDSEYDMGMKPVIDSGDQSIFADMLGKEAKDKKEDEALLEGEFFTNKIKYNFYNIQHKNNKITLNLPQFDPYSVVGMPGILVEKNTGKKYYGKLFSKITTISMGGGNIQTSYSLLFAREFEKLSDITDIVNPYMISVDAEALYERVLKGSGFVIEKEETVANKLRTHNLSVKDGWKVVDNNISQAPREVATFGEYWKSRGVKNGRNDFKKYDNYKNDIIIDNKDLYTTTRKEFSTKDITKQIFVKERREKAKALQDALSKKVLS